MNYFKEAILTLKNSEDRDERFEAVTDLMDLSLSVVFLALALVCLIAGFWRGHCFGGALICLLMNAVIRAGFYSRHGIQ